MRNRISVPSSIARILDVGDTISLAGTKNIKCKRKVVSKNTREGIIFVRKLRWYEVLWERFTNG